jgi:hypothetical protein
MTLQDVKVGNIEHLEKKARRDERRARRAKRRLLQGIKLCGAKTRLGRPCIAKGLENGRCRNHGGTATGPKTPEGKAKALACLRQHRNKAG